MRKFAVLLLIVTLCNTAREAAADGDIGVAVEKIVLTPALVPPGVRIKMRYSWKAVGPSKIPYKVFVHICDQKGKIVLQDDHTPPVGTSTPGWNGQVGYERSFTIPAELADGTYRVILGLYNKSGNAVLIAGSGVRDAGGRRYEAGALVVDSKATRPRPDTDRKPSLDLSGYEPVFREEFDGPLDVSPWGPAARWIAHTPWAGDFGDAAFADPKDGFPFTIEKGVLRIEARKDTKLLKTAPKRKRWRAGLLASNDPSGRGFSLQYGYFEIRTKLPAGPGVWPAFWLCSSYDRKDKNAGKDGSVEIDVFEYYGRAPNSFTATVHTWLPKPHTSKGTIVTTGKNAASSDFNKYGCMVKKDYMTFYFNDVEVWKHPTPSRHNKPLMLLVNLALGPGWPIDKTPNPSYMYVDYIRAYAKKGEKPIIGQPKIDKRANKP